MNDAGGSMRSMIETFDCGLDAEGNGYSYGMTIRAFHKRIPPLLLLNPGTTGSGNSGRGNQFNSACDVTGGKDEV